MRFKERPILKNVVNNETLEIEVFQNKTIRPIIKMQHDILLACFTDYLEEKKVNLSVLTKTQKENKIKSILLKDISFKKMIIGLILGHFSMEEINFYFINKKEIHRRIISITTKRIQDTIV